MKYNLVLLTLLTLLVSCTVQEKKEIKDKTWPNKMKNISASLETLIPIIYSDQKFYDPKRYEENLQAIKDFDKAAHKVKANAAVKLLGQDPIVTAQLKGLKSNLSSASQSFENHNLKYSQYMLKSSISFCFRCHSRQQMGPERYKLKKSHWSQLKMTPIESSELLIATRQYEEAKNVLSDFIFNKRNTASSNFIIEEAIKYYFTIVLRAQNSPEKGIRFLNKLAKQNPPIQMVKENRKIWRKSLARWASGKTKLNLKATEKLINSEPLLFPSTLDWKFIDLLYASAILHKMTNEKMSNKNLSRVYLQLGIVYDRLGEVGFWELPETYFENCIRESPHTFIAGQCYRFLERGVVLGFTGSAGTFVPSDELRRLEELKKISESKE